MNYKSKIRKSITKNSLQQDKRQASLISLWGQMETNRCNLVCEEESPKETVKKEETKNIEHYERHKKPVILHSQHVSRPNHIECDSLVALDRCHDSALSHTESIANVSNSSDNTSMGRNKGYGQEDNASIETRSSSFDDSISISKISPDPHTKVQIMQNKHDNKQTKDGTLLSSNADVKIRDVPSPYELLRLERIKRNEARLAALGLTSNFNLKQKSPPNQKNYPRHKKAKPSHHAPKPIAPVRRSTRLQKHCAKEIQNQQGKVNALKSNSIQSTTIMKFPEEKMKFEISPFLKYAMEHRQKSDKIHVHSSCSNISSQAPKKSGALQLRSFVKAGPKLLPPAGLSAIYSLQFYHDITDQTQSNPTRLIVGAGKAGIISLWNWKKYNTTFSDLESEESLEIEPVLAWKGHKNRWISSSKFLCAPCRSLNHSEEHAITPRLLTAGNDGSVSLWDLSSLSVTTGMPKMLFNNKCIHSSGIFCMDVINENMSASISEKSVIFDEEILVCTGSKDKSVAISTLERMMENTESCAMWRSDFHSGKVAAVALRGSQSSLLLSASDDGLIALHDYRIKGLGNTVPSTYLENVHEKPHSVEWNPIQKDEFMTGKTRDIFFH